MNLLAKLALCAFIACAILFLGVVLAASATGHLPTVDALPWLGVLATVFAALIVFRRSSGDPRTRTEPVHRDSRHHVPGHVVALHRFRRLFGVRAGHVLHRGAHHPVNDHWHAANTARWPHLAGRSRHELRDIQDRLLLKSNHVELTAEEHAYLQAANKHFNVRTSVDFLGGRDHRDFGFEGVDQVHMNGVGYPCGCKLLIVFDHHRARAGEVGYEHHPHPPLQVCDKHAKHAGDLRQLHARVAADSNEG
jgi:hypothetical protein